MAGSFSVLSWDPPVLLIFFFLVENLDETGGSFDWIFFVKNWNQRLFWFGNVLEKTEFRGFFNLEKNRKKTPLTWGSYQNQRTGTRGAHPNQRTAQHWIGVFKGGGEKKQKRKKKKKLGSSCQNRTFLDHFCSLHALKVRDTQKHRTTGAAVFALACATPPAIRVCQITLISGSDLTALRSETSPFHMHRTAPGWFSFLGTSFNNFPIFPSEKKGTH
jgi:hypothetical protein